MSRITSLRSRIAHGAIAQAFQAISATVTRVCFFMGNSLKVLNETSNSLNMLNESVVLVAFITNSKWSSQDFILGLGKGIKHSLGNQIFPGSASRIRSKAIFM